MQGPLYYLMINNIKCRRSGYIFNSIVRLPFTMYDKKRRFLPFRHRFKTDTIRYQFLPTDPYLCTFNVIGGREKPGKSYVYYGAFKIESIKKLEHVSQNMHPVLIFLIAFASRIFFRYGKIYLRFPRPQWNCHTGHWRPVQTRAKHDKRQNDSIMLHICSNWIWMNKDHEFYIRQTSCTLKDVLKRNALRIKVVATHIVGSKVKWKWWRLSTRLKSRKLHNYNKL